jgi:hypothetical protein
VQARFSDPFNEAYRLATSRKYAHYSEMNHANEQERNCSLTRQAESSTRDAPLYVVIITAGKSPTLLRTLKSLEACTQPSRFRGTILAENGVESHGREISKPFIESLKLQYVHVAESGKCKALNAAIDIAPENSLLVFSDNDIRFKEDWIEQYQEASDKCTERSFFGGSFGVDYQDKPTEQIFDLLPMSAKGMEYPEVIEPRPLFLGFNWAVYKVDLIAAGCFDEQIGPGSETCRVGDETDMQTRLINIGCVPKTVPQAWVWHSVPSDRCSPKWLIERSLQIGISRGFLDLKQNGITAVSKAPIMACKLVLLATITLFGSKSLRREDILHQSRYRRTKGWFIGASRWFKSSKAFR